MYPGSPDIPGLPGYTRGPGTQVCTGPLKIWSAGRLKIEVGPGARRWPTIDDVGLLSDSSDILDLAPPPSWPSPTSNNRAHDGRNRAPLGPGEPDESVSRPAERGADELVSGFSQASTSWSPDRQAVLRAPNWTIYLGPYRDPQFGSWVGSEIGDLVKWVSP